MIHQFACERTNNRIRYCWRLFELVNLTETLLCFIHFLSTRREGRGKCINTILFTTVGTIANYRTVENGKATPKEESRYWIYSNRKGVRKRSAAQAKISRVRYRTAFTTSNSKPRIKRHGPSSCAIYTIVNKARKQSVPTTQLPAQCATKTSTNKSIGNWHIQREDHATRFNMLMQIWAHVYVCLCSHGKSNTLVAKVEYCVIRAQEDVAEDPQWARGNVKSHEATHTHLLAFGIDLRTYDRCVSNLLVQQVRMYH